MHNVLVEIGHLKQRLKAYEAQEKRAAEFEQHMERLDGSADPGAAQEEAVALVSKFIRGLGHAGAANAWDMAREGWDYD